MRGATVDQYVKVWSSPTGSKARGDGRVREERLDLGGEPEPAPDAGVVQRPYPEPVPGEHQTLGATVPQRQRPLAVEPGEAVGSPLLPGVQDHLGVAGGAEDVAHVAQLFGEFDVVEDLAVEGHPEVPVRAAHGLGAALGVDDRQPGVPERRSMVAVVAVTVRARGGGAGRSWPAGPPVRAVWSG